MLKKSLLALVLASLVVFTGCANKADVEADQDAAAEKIEKARADAKDAVKSLDDEEVSADEASEDDSSTSAGVALSSDAPVIYFDFDRFDIRSDMQSAIDELADAIKENGGNFRIEGNCDEWGTEEYNYALGLKRAKSVQDALVRAGVDKDNLSLISYGESNPACSESKRECWQQNRRVELTVLP